MIIHMCISGWLPWVSYTIDDWDHNKVVRIWVSGAASTIQMPGFADNLSFDRIQLKSFQLVVNNSQRLPSETNALTYLLRVLQLLLIKSQLQTYRVPWLLRSLKTAKFFLLTVILNNAVNEFVIWSSIWLFLLFHVIIEIKCGKQSPGVLCFLFFSKQNKKRDYGYDISTTKN